MQRIKDWRKLERHPLSAEYTDWPSDQIDQTVEKIKRHKGLAGNGRVILCEHEGKQKILDGWQRQTCCLAAGISPNYGGLPKGWTPEEWVATFNDERRHETPEAIIARAAKRRERVAQSLRAGKSERQIAKEEKVSPGQVHRDKEALTYSGETVEPPSGKPSGASPEAPEPKVTGIDGKSYPASKQKSSVFCDRCTRIGAPIKGCEACKEKRGKAKPGKPPKSGTQKTAFKQFDKDFGPIARFPEAVVKEYPTERNGTYYNRMVNLLNDVANCVRDWKSAIAKGKVA